MGVTAAPACLVAATGGTNGLVACAFRTRHSAVAMASITVAADDDGGATAGAEVTSSGRFHWQSGPMER